MNDLKYVNIIYNLDKNSITNFWEIDEDDFHPTNELYIYENKEGELCVESSGVGKQDAINRILLEMKIEIDVSIDAYEGMLEMVDNLEDL